MSNLERDELREPDEYALRLYKTFIDLVVAIGESSSAHRVRKKMPCLESLEDGAAINQLLGELSEKHRELVAGLLQDAHDDGIRAVLSCIDELIDLAKFQLVQEGRKFPIAPYGAPLHLDWARRRIGDDWPTSPAQNFLRPDPAPTHSPGGAPSTPATTCSFCGLDDSVTNFGRRRTSKGDPVTTICANCLSLCWDIAKRRRDAPSANQELPPIPPEYAEAFRAAQLADRAMRAGLGVLRCSFCDRTSHSSERHFVKGANSLICDVCIEDAAKDATPTSK